MRDFLKKKGWILIAGAIAVLFIVLRFYNLNNSLYFHGDFGRDYLVLINWQKSLKPPLLGPQTSALPYNQSAVYFYLLMPLFLLTKQSILSSTLTLSIFYLGLFIFGLWYFRENSKLRFSLLALGFLIAINPAFVSQSRLVWNPSFVAPLVATSFYALLTLKDKFNYKRLAVFALSISLAISLSYSIVPTFLAFLSVALLLLKDFRNWLKLTLASLLGLFFWFLPMWAFELKHHFFLTKLLVFGEKLTQGDLSLVSKFHDILKHTDLNFSFWWIFLFGLIIILFWVLKFRKKQSHSLEKLYLLTALSTLVINLLIIFIAPIGVASHYIFGVLTLFLILISLLPRNLSLVATIFLALIWLQPKNLNQYFQPAVRSYEQSLQCAKLICNQVREPLFVSEQSSHHVYHNAIAWKYLLTLSGCKVKNLDTEIDQANIMAVVLEDSDFQLGKTAYNELTQFGPAQVEKKIVCSMKNPQLEVILLKKLNQ